MYFQILNLQEINIQLSKELELPENIRIVKKIKNRTNILKRLEDEKVFFDNLQERLDKQEIINDLLIKSILEEIPDSVSLTVLYLNHNEVEIQGKATGKNEIAQMEHNLRKSQNFNKVFIPFIIKENNFYTFSTTFKVEDVDTNGSK